VLRYLEQHPERTHESFGVLAVQALRLAWPCPNDPAAAAGRSPRSRSILLLARWIIAGQPPSSYQTPFSTMEACQAARTAVVEESVRLNAEWAKSC
jgi:hypothetical protein